jgi:hypothetical protein
VLPQKYQLTMQELLHFAVAPVNIVFTGLLIIVALYWISVMLGALDMSALDLDLDLDVDTDMDMDLDSDLDGGSSVNWVASTLSFFNFNRLPFMVIISVLILSVWALEILSNYYIGNGEIGFMLALLAPILFVSLVITKLVTTPLVPLFANLDGGAENIDYIGQECLIKFSSDAGKINQAEVIVDGNPLVINVQSTRPLTKGMRAIITRYVSDKKWYQVEKI